MLNASTSLILGCGYLGRHVAALWRQQGRRVYAATRNAAHLPADVEPIICDVLDPASLRALPEVDTVLYAIGFDRTSGATMRSVYVDGLANVLAAMFSPLPSAGEGPGVRGRAPRRFIYISSSSVYGQTDGGWVDESSPTEPAEPSGQIVLEAESQFAAFGVAPILLRFAGIYGPGRLLRRQTIEKGEPIIGDADKWLNLIHVEDGARAVLAAEAYGQPGRIYNVCDDHPVRRRYFYAALAKAIGAPDPLFSPLPPAGEGRSFSPLPLGEGSGVRVLPPHERANRRINNRRMKEELRVALRYPDYGQGLRGSG